MAGAVDPAVGSIEKIGRSGTFPYKGGAKSYLGFVPPFSEPSPLTGAFLCLLAPAQCKTSRGVLQEKERATPNPTKL